MRDYDVCVCERETVSVSFWDISFDFLSFAHDTTLQQECSILMYLHTLTTPESYMYSQICLQPENIFNMVA